VLKYIIAPVSFFEVANQCDQEKNAGTNSAGRGKVMSGKYAIGNGVKAKNRKLARVKIALKTYTVSSETVSSDASRWDRCQQNQLKKIITDRNRRDAIQLHGIKDGKSEGMNG